MAKSETLGERNRSACVCENSAAFSIFPTATWSGVEKSLEGRKEAVGGMSLIFIPRPMLLSSCLLRAHAVPIRLDATD